jgi:LmbE family N-acetylglucosaminyl deacetylase
MNILSFFAHPDDETIFIGGTLALLAERGAEVHYLCATRGEGGEVGDPPLCSQDALGSVREEELSRAVQALGGKNLSFLDYRDPLVGPGGELSAYTDDFDGLVEKLRGHLTDLEPDAVITHGSRGEYGHPGHLLSHQAMRAAVMSLPGNQPLLYTVAPYFEDHPRPRHVNGDDPADLVIDITPALGPKTSAALSHRSQHALFLRHGAEREGREVTVPEILMEVEALHLVNPPADGAAPDPLTTLLKDVLID